MAALVAAAVALLVAPTRSRLRRSSATARSALNHLSHRAERGRTGQALPHARIHRAHPGGCGIRGQSRQSATHERPEGGYRAPGVRGDRRPGRLPTSEVLAGLRGGPLPRSPAARHHRRSAERLPHHLRHHPSVPGGDDVPEAGRQHVRGPAGRCFRPGEHGHRPRRQGSRAGQRSLLRRGELAAEGCYDRTRPRARPGGSRTGPHQRGGRVGDLADPRLPRGLQPVQAARPLHTQRGAQALLQGDDVVRPHGVLGEPEAAGRGRSPGPATDPPGRPHDPVSDRGHRAIVEGRLRAHLVHGGQRRRPLRRRDAPGDGRGLRIPDARAERPGRQRQDRRPARRAQQTAGAHDPLSRQHRPSGHVTGRGRAQLPRHGPAVHPRLLRLPATGMATRGDRRQATAHAHGARRHVGAGVRPGLRDQPRARTVRTSSRTGSRSS